MMRVAVLFARRDSVYKTMPGCDVYDFDRDALSFGGGCQVVAHPPCRAWGVLRGLANPRQGEKELAYFAVNAVRACGGVLEHPKGSTLWDAASLPGPGKVDKFGGWTFPVSQSWWGHRAEKPTLLYIVGRRLGDVPEYPLNLGLITHVVGSMKGRRKGEAYWRPAMHTPEREKTPPALAAWLVDLARGCKC